MDVLYHIINRVLKKHPQIHNILSHKTHIDLISILTPIAQAQEITRVSKALERIANEMRIASDIAERDLIFRMEIYKEEKNKPKIQKSRPREHSRL